MCVGRSCSAVIVSPWYVRRGMDGRQPNNPLHGITLRAVLEDLIERRGWEDLADRVRIRCFSHDPSLESSLKFLRKTQWARDEVEALYLQDQRQLEAKRERNRQRAARRAHRPDQDPGDEPPSQQEPEPDPPETT